jgi:hypothetical protein
MFNKREFENQLHDRENCLLTKKKLESLLEPKKVLIPTKKLQSLSKEELIKLPMHYCKLDGFATYSLQTARRHKLQAHRLETQRGNECMTIIR